MSDEKPEAECWCSKDEDGRCAVCSERLSAVLFQFMDAMFKMPKMLASLCQSCRKSHADAAAAKAIRELAAAYPLMCDVSAVTAFVNNFVASSGITKTPLLNAEIQRLAQRKNEGQDPSPKM
jgi:hypothetical protein